MALPTGLEDLGGVLSSKPARSTDAVSVETPVQQDEKDRGGLVILSLVEIDSLPLAAGLEWLFK
jgi:hypothetical protein